jgi:hypothetical protein
MQEEQLSVKRQRVLCISGSGEAWLKSEKHAEFGTEIQLPCILKLPQCIGLHSIKWYQGNERIFVYSAEGEMMLASDEVASRYVLEFPICTTSFPVH